MSNRKMEDKGADKSGDLSVEDLQKVAAGIIFVGGITASRPTTSEKEPIILAEDNLAKVVGGASAASVAAGQKAEENTQKPELSDKDLQQVAGGCSSGKHIANGSV